MHTQIKAVETALTNIATLLKALAIQSREDRNLRDEPLLASQTQVQDHPNRATGASGTCNKFGGYKDLVEPNMINAKPVLVLLPVILLQCT